MVADTESKDFEAPKSSAKESWDWKEHVPLLVTGFSILFIGLRLLSISHGDYETAEGIVQASGTATIIIGALEPIFGFVALPAGLVILLSLRHKEANKPLKPLAIALAIFLILVGLSLGPISVIVILLVSPVLGWAAAPGTQKLTDAYVRHARPRRATRIQSAGKPKNPIFYASLAYAVVMLYIVVINPVPWLPAEDVASTSMPTFSGYVVGESGTELTILTNNTRQIEHIDISKIISRKVCRAAGVTYGGILLTTLPNLIDKTDAPHYPSCQSS